MANTIELVLPSAHPSPQPKRQIDRFSRFCTAYSREWTGTLCYVVYVMCSVPQGSVLGPLFFILYTAHLADRVARYSVSLRAYVDDTQLYLHFCHNEIASSVDQLERCVLGISHWMSANQRR